MIINTLTKRIIAIGILVLLIGTSVVSGYQYTKKTSTIGVGVLRGSIMRSNRVLDEFSSAFQRCIDYNEEVIVQEEQYEQLIKEEYLQQRNSFRSSRKVVTDNTFLDLMHHRALRNDHYPLFETNKKINGIMGKRVQKVRPIPTGNTLFVGGSGPNNYTRIQDAIDRSIDGDTVFVYNDSSPYYEYVIIRKSINLLGEDRNSTIIQGSMSKDVVTIKADFVDIRGFTIKNGVITTASVYWYAGICVYSKNSNITNNVIKENDIGILLYEANNNNIIENSISNNLVLGIGAYEGSSNIISKNDIKKNDNRGIVFQMSSNNIVSYNNIIDNGQYISSDGIELAYNSSNNIITNNNIQNNLDHGIGCYISSNNYIWNNTILHHKQTGIYLFDSSDNNNISANNIQYTDEGIRTENCFHNSVYENNIRLCDYGIFIFNSFDVIIYLNNIEMNTNGGVVLLDSSEIQIKNNNFISDGIFIDGNSPSYWNTHIIENNSINTKPIYYYKNNHNGLTIPSVAGQVILANCSQFNIENLTITDSDRAIQLGFSKYNTIANNLLLENRIGIYLGCSPFNKIINNTFSSNGIIIESIYKKDWNTHKIENNFVNGKPIYYYKNNHDSLTVPSNAGQVILANCSQIKICNNTFNNLDSGVQVGFSSRINIVENKFYNTSWAGISLWFSNNNSISKNICNNNWGGVYFSECFDNNIYGNIISKSNVSGIEIEYSSNNCFLKNIIYNCTIGITVEYFSNKNNFSKNSITNISEIGLWIYNSNNGLYEYNIVSNNILGVVLENTSNNNLFHNNTIANNDEGIFLADSYDGPDYNLISNNIILNNKIGIDLYQKSNNNIISNNKVQANKFIGINLYDCSNNHITENNITTNKYGIVFVYANNNTINYNYISRNNQSGINLFNSDKNLILNNLCKFNIIDGVGLNPGCSKNILENNICLDNMKGIAVRDSSFNDLHSNFCKGNQQGILLNKATLNDMTNNACSDNKIGIYFYNSRLNSLKQNMCNRCDYQGIVISRSMLNNIMKNDIGPYNWVGMVVENSMFNRIRNNNISNSNYVGVALTKTVGNHFNMNNIHDNCKYEIAGFLCCDNARLNFWGGGAPKKLVFGWVRIIPWLSKSVEISNLL